MLLLSLDCSTLPLIRTLYCWVLSKEVSSTIFKSLVWRDLGLNPGLPDHWRTFIQLHYCFKRYHDAKLLWILWVIQVSRSQALKKKKNFCYCKKRKKKKEKANNSKSVISWIFFIMMAAFFFQKSNLKHLSSNSSAELWGLKTLSERPFWHISGHCASGNRRIGWECCVVYVKQGFMYVLLPTKPSSARRIKKLN